MGGDAPQQETTESEIALAEIRDEQWQQYLEDRPVQDAYIKQAVTDRLNPDGSVKTNTSAQQLATESASTDMMLSQYGQGNVDQAIDDRVALATGEAEDASEKAFQDQSDYLTGLDNVAAMGQGQEMELVEGQTSLAARANQNATTRAQEIAATRAGNAEAVGSLAGIGLGAYVGSRNSNKGFQYKPQNYNLRED
jgi:hypothetical protein